ncbi:MAG: hypothetical protein OEZ39_07375 [Gammaproteobacteria bacterium]|nr:hypothetical protein [Gammaproteobacteria bacterium]MDH5651678.1 hypothetical protein [Gammaproteobacteria bacterium]
MNRIIAAVLLIIAVPQVYADQPEGECHIHKSHAFHFRDYKVKDILEISVGPGPCPTALMTLNIRSAEGEVFYTYVSRFADHVTPDPYDPNFDKFVEPFFTTFLAELQKNANSMPKYHRQDEKLGLIKLYVSEKHYNTLKVRPLPVFFQPISHDSWLYLVYDAQSRKGKKVISGKYH